MVASLLACRLPFSFSYGLQARCGGIQRNLLCQSIRLREYPNLHSKLNSQSLVLHKVTCGISADQAESMTSVSSVQEQLKEHLAEGGWEKAWEKSTTPWDLGGVTPAITSLLAAGAVPDGRMLVPGCGTGYDVLALASPSRHVVGLDLSETAVSRARQAAEGKPGAEHAEFVNGNFFEYSPSSPFDGVFDYTFFCAIDPALRADWAAKMAELLAPLGQLFTLMFPLSDHAGGPPFAVSLEAYEAVLGPHGFKVASYPAVEGVTPARQGKEKLAVWKRSGPAKI